MEKLDASDCFRKCQAFPKHTAPSEMTCHFYQYLIYPLNNTF